MSLDCPNGQVTTVCDLILASAKLSLKMTESQVEVEGVWEPICLESPLVPKQPIRSTSNLLCIISRRFWATLPISETSLQCMDTKKVTIAPKWCNLVMQIMNGTIYRCKLLNQSLMIFITKFSMNDVSSLLVVVIMIVWVTKFLGNRSFIRDLGHALP